MSASQHPPQQQAQPPKKKNKKKKLLPWVPIISPVPLCDIGANLASSHFHKDMAEVVQRAQDTGVQCFLVTGTSMRSSHDAVQLCTQYPDLMRCTVGVHPHDAKSCKEGETIEKLRELANNPLVACIGECGLDFNRNFSPQDVQLEWFEKQVQLACEVQKPLFVHEREASTALLSVLDRYKEKLPHVVVHCFTGTADEIRAYVERGFFVSITGFVGKKNRGEELRQVLAQGCMPLQRLMIETDCPYMCPDVEKSYRRFFRRNEPCTLPLVARVIADSMGVPMEEVARATSTAFVEFVGKDSVPRQFLDKLQQ